MESKEQIEETISKMLLDENKTEYYSLAERLLVNNDAKKLVNAILSSVAMKHADSSKGRTRERSDGRHPKSGTRDRRSNRERAISRPSEGETKGRTEFGRRSAGPKKPIRRGFKKVARKPVRPKKR